MLNSIKKARKTNRGITLIALVITIIVLLILAGVTIATLTGDNGLLQKATNAKETSTNGEIEEEIKLAWNKVYSDAYLNNYTPEQKAEALKTELGDTATRDKLTVTYRGKTIVITDTGSMEIKQARPQVIAGQKAEKDSEYKSGNYTAIIPAGFTVSATESSIENGLVVTDGSSNEWVWIPVSSEDLAKMYEECNTNNELLIEENITKVATPYKSKASTDVRSDLTRGNPNSTGWREPGLLASSSFDGNGDYRIAAGFVEEGGTASSLETMATKLKDDYKDMIDSIRENGGFYIGRYEIGGSISEPLVQKGKTVITNTNWYNLYKACKSFSKGNVESRMIWGCQWDQVCRFISTYKEGNETKTRSLTDSITYGNYNNSSGNAKVVVDGQNKYGNKQSTGFSEYWKTNNIYDIAGNCLEWTQEAYNTNLRAGRGR